nr:MAG: putative non-structural protein [Culex hudovirus]
MSSEIEKAIEIILQRAEDLAIEERREIKSLKFTDEADFIEINKVILRLNKAIKVGLAKSIGKSLSEINIGFLYLRGPKHFYQIHLTDESHLRSE